MKSQTSKHLSRLFYHGQMWLEAHINAIPRSPDSVEQLIFVASTKMPCYAAFMNARTVKLSPFQLLRQLET